MVFNCISNIGKVSAVLHNGIGYKCELQSFVFVLAYMQSKRLVRYLRLASPALSTMKRTEATINQSGCMYMLIIL